ncbi:MAG: M20/M25/M40 family metallo-hydrolase [Elusimicrobiota bacterium]
MTAAIAACVVALGLLSAAPAGAAEAETRLARDTRAHLRALVRIDTSNPPGQERKAADYIRAALQADGIAVELYPSTGPRAGAFARLKGTGGKKPILLVCHTDTVPVDRAEWSVDPFAAVEKDGYLYGRGAADNKGMCAAEMAVLQDLKRSGLKLARDVVFFAAADEESGEPVRYMDRLVRDRPELLASEFAINEGGVTLWDNGRVMELQVQTAEKDFLDVTLTARGSAGHPAVSSAGNPVAALLRAADRLAAVRFSSELTPLVQEFLHQQHASATAPLKSAIYDVLSADMGVELDQATDRLAGIDPEYAAMLRDTLTPTVLEAGYKSNVVPARARAVFNARLMPGRDPAVFLDQVREVIAEPGVTVSCEAGASSHVPAMPLDSELYRAVEEAALKFAPGARVMPFLSPWSTDSRQLRAAGVRAYGISLPLSPDDGVRVHGKDERVDLAALDWYAAYLREVVAAVSGG